MKLKSLLSLLAVFVAAKASAITYDAAINGTTYNGFTVSATGGVAGVATYPQNMNISILGVLGGYAGPEIGPRQTLTISFATPQSFEYLTFGLLFDGPEYGDSMEIAAVTTPIQYTLQAVASGTAEWKKGATLLQNVMNAGTAVQGNMGLWSITNPFPGQLISSLTLFPLTIGNNPLNNDFGIVGFKTPDAGSTIALSGMALLALGFFARRRK